MFSQGRECSIKGVSPGGRGYLPGCVSSGECLGRHLPTRWPLPWLVCILLECVLVYFGECYIFSTECYVAKITLQPKIVSSVIEKHNINH